MSPVSLSHYQHSAVKEIFLWRLSNAVLWSVLMQIFFLWIYLCVIYFNIFHPLLWVRNTFVLLTSLYTWTRLIPCGFILFLQGVYCGKDYLHPQPSYSTRFSFFLHLFSLHNIFLCSLHMISGGLTVWLYLSMLGGHYTSVIKNCQSEGDSLCLAEGNLFLFLSGFWNGMVYFLKDHAFAPASVNFPPIQQAKFIQVKSSLGHLFKVSMKNSLLPVVSFAIFYHFKGAMFKNLFISTFSLHAVEDISVLFFMKNVHIIFYCWLFSTLFLTTMNSMEMLFNVYLSEHSYFAIEKHPDTITLSEALTQGPEILNKLAAQDLMIMAFKDKMRRSTVFSLSQPGGHATNWTNLSKRCLEIVNNYSRDLNNIIGDKSIDSSNKLNSNVPQMTVQRSIKSPKLRNMSQSACLSPQGDVVIVTKEVKISSIIKNELSILLNALSKKPGINYFFGDIPELKLKWVVLRGQTVSRVAQGLSQLVAASINEDVFGVVQDDLSSIITSLLHLKQALDKLSKSGIANKKSLRQDVIVTQMLAELKSSVKRSIYKITITFGKYIKDIPLDTETQQGLQSFITMREG